MQTMGSILSYYLEGENSAPGITGDGLNKLVKEQFPHCKREEISPGVYEIRIPMGSRTFRIYEKELRTASENTLSPHKISLGSSMLPEGSIRQMVNEDVTNLQAEEEWREKKREGPLCYIDGIPKRVAN
ncbi:UNVERIFIED_CONTAM: hypothetical protein K2H54_023046 [Gekko kuhli]